LTMQGLLARAVEEMEAQTLFERTALPDGSATIH
jgi:hypothetical protein